MPYLLKAESSPILETELAGAIHGVDTLGESADNFSQAEHARNFIGTTEQARALCPYLGKLSFEEADQQIHDQVKKEAALDSFMDKFEAKQKEAGADKTTPQSRSLAVADTTKTVAKTETDIIHNAFILAESAGDNTQSSGPETKTVVDRKVLGEEYRDKARRLAIEQLTALHERERIGIVTDAAIVNVRPDTLLPSLKEQQVAQSLAPSEIKPKVTEILAVPVVPVNENISLRQTLPASLNLESRTTSGESKVTPLFEFETTQAEADHSEFEPLQLEADHSESEPLQEHDFDFADIHTDDLEPLMAEMSVEMSESQEQSSTNAVPLSIIESDDGTPSSDEVILTLEAQDAAKISLSLMASEQSIYQLEGVAQQTETTVDEYVDEIEAKVSEIVHRAEAMQTVAELVETVEQLQSEISLIHTEASGQLTRKSDEFVELILDAPKGDTEALVAKIEQLIEHLVLLDKSDTVQYLVDDLLNNPALEILFENSDGIENRLKYLSERLGTREVLGTVHQTKSLLQRTVHYVHQLIGASTLNLYGLNSDRKLVTE